VISEPVQGKNFNTGESYSPKIVVENDNIYVVWHDNNNTNGSDSNDDDIFYRNNLTGSKWENIQVISEPVAGKNLNTLLSRYPAIAVENGKIYVTWQDENNTKGAGIDTDLFFRCNLTGIKWENIQVISEPISGWNFNIGGSAESSIAVENGKIYIVWADNNNTNGGGTDSDIFYRCNLTGSRWEKVQLLSEPVFGQNFTIGESFRPEIAVENGKIYVVWQDENNTNGAGTDHEIFYRYNVTGVSWEDIQIISEPVVGKNFNTGPSAYPDIAVTHGKNHIIWSDFNDTYGSGFDGDIFYMYLFLPHILSLQRVTPNSGNTSTVFNFTITYFNLLDLPPKEILISFSGKEYSLIEVDQNDNNYIDGKKYFFNIKNLNVGLYTYQFIATDGKKHTFSKLLNGPNVFNIPPKIITEDNITVFEDTYYEVDYEYEDMDVENVGQEVTWKFSSNADWLTFNPASAIIYGNPDNDDVGEYWINISISDTIDTDYTNYTLTVFNVNDPPKIISKDTINVTVDELYSVNYEAEDIDPVPVVFNWFLNSNTTGWLTINTTTGGVSGIPTQNDVGTFWVNISVTDGENGWNYHNFTLKVIGYPIQSNNAPRLFNATITPLEGDTNTVFIFSIKYYDKDSEPPKFIQVIIDNADYYMELVSGENASNGTYKYSTTLSEGMHTYYFTASDGIDAAITEKTNTEFIKKAAGKPKTQSSWFWIIIIIAFIIIISVIITSYFYLKRRIARIPTVKAELLKPSPESRVLPSPQFDGITKKPLTPSSTVPDKLPTKGGQVQPTINIPIEKIPVKLTAPVTSVKTQYQLPQETLTKNQKLGLLNERFLRGEVTEKTYKELKAEIEKSNSGDITKKY
jgi:uncharacterized membrane protein